MGAPLRDQVKLEAESAPLAHFAFDKESSVVNDLDTSALLWDFEHALYVEFQPIKEMVPLTIKGKVLEAKDIARSKTDKGPSDARSPGNKPVKR